MTCVPQGHSIEGQKKCRFSAFSVSFRGCVDGVADALEGPAV